jgi:hypothetical protein
MIKAALEYLDNLLKKPWVEIEGKMYNVKLDNTLIPLEEVDKVRIQQVPTMETHTLTSIIDYLKLNPDNLDLKKMYIHILSHAEVFLTSIITGDYREKELYILAQCLIPEIPLNRFLDIETFLIMLNSNFLPTNDLRNIIEIVSKVVDNKVINFEDDGISQKVNIKSGIELVREEKLPVLNTLKPYRTFVEADQPYGDFLLRARKGSEELQYALYEADGGVWRNKAILIIKDYLERSLEELEISIPILA